MMKKNDKDYLDPFREEETCFICTVLTVFLTMAMVLTMAALVYQALNMAPVPGMLPDRAASKPDAVASEPASGEYASHSSTPFISFEEAMQEFPEQVEKSIPLHTEPKPSRK